MSSKRNCQQWMTIHWEGRALKSDIETAGDTDSEWFKATQKMGTDGCWKISLKCLEERPHVARIVTEYCLNWVRMVWKWPVVTMRGEQDQKVSKSLKTHGIIPVKLGTRNPMYVWNLGVYSMLLFSLFYFILDKWRH